MPVPNWKSLLRVVVTITILCCFVAIFHTVVADQQTMVEMFEPICGLTKLNRVDIWSNTKKKYGAKVATSIFPQTYLLPSEVDQVVADPAPHFILKTLWSGGRSGVKLFNDKQQIRQNRNKYAVAQVYIKNPLLVNGFKFDIRFFMVAICGRGVFLYRKGYNVYTKEPFNYDSMNPLHKINQAYVKDDHYEQYDLPKTTDALARRLNFSMEPVMASLVSKLNYILSSTESLCCPTDIGGYNIYGIDVELLDNLDPVIIEINSGPTTGFKEKWKNDLIRPVRHFSTIDTTNLWIKLDDGRQ